MGSEEVGAGLALAIVDRALGVDPILRDFCGGDSEASQGGEHVLVIGAGEMAGQGLLVFPALEYVNQPFVVGVKAPVVGQASRLASAALDMGPGGHQGFFDTPGLQVDVAGDDDQFEFLLVGSFVRTIL